jgi:AraC-like DNA-binding protein
MRATGDRHGVLGLPPLLALANERGLDSASLLREAGVAPTLLDDATASVPVERVHHLVRLMVERTGDATLGLDAGRHYHFATFGLLGAVAALTPTAREMIHLFVEYTHLTFTFFLLQFDEEAESGRVTFVPDGDLGALYRFYLDRELAFVFETARQLWPQTHERLLLGVDIDYPEPPEAARYRAVFRAPPRFGAPQAAVSIDFTADRPRADANPLGLGLLKEHLRSFGGMGRCGDDVVDHVRREVTLSIATRQQLPAVDAIAARFGLSERALRRRLSAGGTSFRALADDVIAPLAKRYLRDSRLSVAAIAERLGYSEPASFVRAFRRWTGTTPDAFRS